MTTVPNSDGAAAGDARDDHEDFPPMTQTESDMQTTHATLTKKQVKQLRSLAHHLGPMLWIGKNGISESAISQADETLLSHELIKCSVLDACPLDARQAAEELAEHVGASLVQVIGHRFVLYRHSDKEGIKNIALAR
jgi:RNA-binding protein